MAFPLARHCALALAAVAAWMTLTTSAPASPRVEALLARMTVEEKVGQLNLVSGNHAVTGPFAPQDVRDAILKGQAGGLFNVYGAEYTRSLQELATRETRLGIPLLLGFDVLHGYRTILPIPLGQAASWDMEAIEQGERVSAAEASAAGVNWIFAPMVDVSRDPRWGRVAEGGGESAWLGARIASARVRGLEGARLSATDSVAACVKHFAGNGATEAGRDYSGLDLSERALREQQLPPFQAAVESRARCVMAAFNAVDGVPGVANERLLRDILRREWGFDGIVVSDFGAIGELPVHGVAEDGFDAARIAFRAGTDMDMESRSYIASMPLLVREGLVPGDELDASVRRILQLKEDLGLFDDPFARSDPQREAAVIGSQAHREAALRLAEKSLVLLKNERRTLPFATDAKRVAIIGPLGDSGADTLGPWAAHGDPEAAITLKEGVEAVLGAGAQVTALAAGTIEQAKPRDIAAAAKLASQSDIVILALGEHATQSGEAASRSSLDLPGDQMALARAVLAVGKPTAVALFNGRPLTIEDLDREAPAILEAWFPGSEGGLAVARTLFGLNEPTGRLPISFPRSVGQIPIYHDHLPTGRPAMAAYKPYTSAYIDLPSTPLYAFGHGLSYTRFEMGEPRVDRLRMGSGESARITVPVANVGDRPGAAQAQLYIRHRVARLSRPVRELKGMGRVALKAGETGEISFTLSEQDLAYWQPGGRFALPDGGPIEIHVGPDAGQTRMAVLDYRPDRQAPAAEAARVDTVRPTP
ncbi:beta-glucosidase [Alsobacter metallidurans]|uniref:beta-glucosidase n=1 Tax=Alsobacter metallidurans TaxID=340221 RepID=A0A917MIV7_9HYPH|nr:glycoside hydrolase family 3 N-terminal domain-containing protein [Alsobacter metallidurans]GGH26945.1 beta-glucosidase [Alsobacter metallidurans]